MVKIGGYRRFERVSQTLSFTYHEINISQVTEKFIFLLIMPLQMFTNTDMTDNVTMKKEGNKFRPSPVNQKRTRLRKRRALKVYFSLLLFYQRCQVF